MDSGKNAPGGRDEEVRESAERDRALVRAARAGDGAAFEELVLRHRNRIFWVARQVVGDTEEAKDVTQNVLLRLWRTLPRYDEQYAFSTWLYRMTVNLSIDSLRRGARQKHATDLDDTLVALDPVTGQPSRADQPAQSAEVRRILDELQSLLPPQQRAAFVLREMEGLSSEEVAAVLGLSSSTVRNHLFQARRMLKTELERRYPEYVPERILAARPGRDTPSPASDAPAGSGETSPGRRS